MDNLPKTYEKLVVRTLTTNFHAAVKIESVDMCEPKNGEICVKNRYVGVNATDVNVTKGRYFVEGNVPYDIGFECILETDAFPIPDAKPEYLVLLVSGLTASIGLDKSARIMNGETVLITAAAGGAGHMAVQWAKAADCHVIGTCSSEDKKNVLKDLGCDCVINYKKEDLAAVLSKECPRGIDVIWETIGGSVFETCLKNLAVKGRLIIVGGISGYKNEHKEALPRTELFTMPEMLRFRSAAVQGFLLLHYKECFSAYFKYLVESLECGKIKAICDLGKNGEEFVGMKGIIKGVQVKRKL